VVKAAELRDLPLAELEQRLVEAKEELFNLRFQNATGQLDNYKRLGQLRKDVARIKTLLRERELEEVARAEEQR
jgi:large subunit ribosomal protein L29